MSVEELSQILGNFGEFVGAIAVVVTLLYVAKQIREANREARATTTQAVFDSDLLVQSQINQYADTWDKIVTGQSLSDGAETRLGISLFNMSMSLNENRFKQVESGHLEHRFDSIEVLVSMPIYAAWRASGAASARSPEFLAFVDEHRQRAPTSPQ